MGNGEDTHLNCCPSSPSSLTISSTAAAASIFKPSSTSDQDPFFVSTWNQPLLHMIGQNPSPNFRPPSLIRPTSSSSHFSDISNHSFGLTEGGAMGEEDSPRGKRKRKESEPPNAVLFNATKKGVCIDDKRNMKEANLPGKQRMSNEAEEIPNNGGGEDPKETYSHVRARRGQATNRHSLAERERRERISERMKLLQELVPGCNKITGKAVMLDEIINYVQSLQQQVEFLSMKLATVNPELNIDIERILSKEMIMHSRGGNTILLPGFGRSPNEPLSYLPGIQTGNAANLIPYHHTMMPQTIWDNDLHNLLHMGFDSNQVFHNLGQKGCQKSDL